jgi:hypothetical protein
MVQVSITVDGECIALDMEGDAPAECVVRVKRDDGTVTEAGARLMPGLANARPLPALPANASKAG